MSSSGTNSIYTLAQDRTANTNEELNTLAQDRTANTNEELKETIIYGTGTPIENNPAILKRANKKAISNALARAMADIANTNNETDMAKRYWNTYYCQNKLVSHGGRYYTDYCKNRWCATCCGIRKAYILNQYYPIIKEWDEPHLLTITLRSVSEDKLKKRINDIVIYFKRIIDRTNKRHLRGKGMKIKCIKSLECNFNATKRTYNPHFHIITPNRQIALYIKQEWAKEWNRKTFNVGAKGQHLTKIDNLETGLVEVIKYGAKILCDPNPDMKRKRSKGDMTGLNIYANALHIIYKAFDKHRLYSSIGFKLPKTDIKTTTFKKVFNFETWLYKPQEMNWISVDSNNNFTEYEIDSYLKHILQSCIDKVLH